MHKITKNISDFSKSEYTKNILTTAEFTNKIFYYSLDPLIVNVANPGIKLTTVLFAKQTDCLLVGDSDGQVAVYELRNMPTALSSGRVKFKILCNCMILFSCNFVLYKEGLYISYILSVVQWKKYKLQELLSTWHDSYLFPVCKIRIMMLLSIRFIMSYERT